MSATITTVSATFSNGDGSTPRSRDVQLTFDGRVVAMVGGPTGYESFLIEDWIKYPKDGSWTANVGTPGRWDLCVVSAPEMARALRELGAAG